MSSSGDVNVSARPSQRWLFVDRESPPPSIHLIKDVPRDFENFICSTSLWIDEDALRMMLESKMYSEDAPGAPPIEITNNVDEQAIPIWNYHYSHKMWIGGGVSPPDFDSAEGCQCNGPCSDKEDSSCACLLKQRDFYRLTEDIIPIDAGFNVDPDGYLRYPDFPIVECNYKCACAEYCQNRVSLFIKSYWTLITPI